MKIIFYNLIFVVLLVGCEDTKKHSMPSQVEDPNLIKEVQDSLPKKTIPKKKKSEYPQITNENVVEFLSEYGRKNPETKVLIETVKGDIEIELYKDTPLHRANFIYLVKQGYFDETFFHRVVPEFIIQAGNSDLVSTQRKRDQLSKDYLLPAEIIPGRIHQAGTVSGAKEYRENPDNRTAPYEFFIYLGPPSSAAHLNGSYTIFGRVTKGMEVVKEISELKTDNSEWPVDNIYIKARILN